MRLFAALFGLLVITILITIQMPKCVAVALAMSDTSVAISQISNIALQYGEKRFVITLFCAYWDLLAFNGALLAFIALKHRIARFTLVRGAAILLAFLFGVQFLNIVRIATAIRLSSHGIDWDYAHNIPDIILRVIYYIASCILVLRITNVDSPCNTSEARKNPERSSNVALHPGHPM